MIPVHSILHPTDFSAGSLAAFDLACDLARDYGARLILLHVAVPPVPFPAAGLMGFDMVEFAMARRARLDRLCARDPGIVPEYRLVIGADPVREILCAARAERCDFIVMGSHADTRHDSLGNIADRVQREASCPVLTASTHGAARRPAAMPLAESMLCGCAG